MFAKLFICKLNSFIHHFVHVEFTQLQYIEIKKFFKDCLMDKKIEKTNFIYDYQQIIM